MAVPARLGVLSSSEEEEDVNSEAGNEDGAEAMFF